MTHLLLQADEFKARNDTEIIHQNDGLIAYYTPSAASLAIVDEESNMKLDSFIKVTSKDAAMTIIKNRL